MREEEKQLMEIITTALEIRGYSAKVSNVLENVIEVVSDATLESYTITIE